jgi:aspartyl protease family protein
MRFRLRLKVDHANLRVDMVAAGVPVDFVLDTGSSDLAVPAGTFERMNLPVSGSAIFVLADGRKVKHDTFVIPVLEANGVRVTNIKASVSPRGSDPLLGLSFLHRFESYTIDRNANALVLE